MFTHITKSKKREMIKQKLEEATETVWETLIGLEEKYGVYRPDITQPRLTAKILLGDVIDKWEAEDTAALDALQEKIEEVTGESFYFYAGSLVIEIEEEVYEAQSMFGGGVSPVKDKTLVAIMDTEIATLDLNLAAILSATNAKLKELIEEQGLTRYIDPCLNFAVVERIIGNWFTAETEEKVKQYIKETGKGLTFGGIVRLRTNYMKNIDLRIRQNKMLQDEARKLKKVFFDTLSKDFYDNLDKIVVEGKITPEQAQHFRQTDETYKAKIELPDTRWFKNLMTRPEMAIDHLILLKTEELEAVKNGLGPKLWKELQPSILANLINRATRKGPLSFILTNLINRPMGERLPRIFQNMIRRAIYSETVDLTSKGLQNVLNSIRSSLDVLLEPDTLQRYQDLLDEVKRTEETPEIRKTPAAKHIIEWSEREAPVLLFQEFTKKGGGIFNSEQLGHLKKFMEPRWGEFQAGLTGMIFERASIMKDEETNCNTMNLSRLSEILDTMREGNPKILVDIFGEEWAKELTELAIFLKRLLDD